MTDDKFVSVTTILGCLDKPGLMYWAAERAAEAAMDSTATWQAMLEDRGRAEAVKWIRDGFRRRARGRLSDAELGTVVHALAEDYAIRGTRPTKAEVKDRVVSHGSTAEPIDAGEVDTALASLEQFEKWCQRFQPEYQAAELTVLHPTARYAGTCDAFLTISGVRFIVDYKTSRTGFDSRGKLKIPHLDNAMQLAAYRHAELAVPNPRERISHYGRRYYPFGDHEQATGVPVPEVDAAVVIKISPEDCSAYPVETGPQVFDGFLRVMRVFRFTDEAVIRDADGTEYPIINRSPLH